MDYSQSGEQVAIVDALGGLCTRDAPQFIDIGAWHPTTFSNTRALFEMNWGGLFIEPSPGPVQGLVREYGRCDRVKVIAAAVGVVAGLMEMEVTDDAVSMPVSDQLRMETWKSAGGFYGRLTVPVIGLGDLFSRFGGEFQMVSIDTEGTSCELFAELIRLGPRPRVICVEHDNRLVELNQWAQSASYRQYFLSENNAVFQWTSGL